MSAGVRLLSVPASLLCALVPILAFSQTETTGRMAGTIRDAQGAVVVNSAITAKNGATGEKRATASDRSGNYVLIFLPPWAYELNVSAPGFATAHSSSLRVGINQTTTVNVTLSVASTSFEVWSPLDSGRLLLRGGYGIFFAHPQLSATSGAILPGLLFAALLSEFCLLWAYVRKSFSQRAGRKQFPAHPDGLCVGHQSFRPESGNALFSARQQQPAV